MPDQTILIFGSPALEQEAEQETLGGHRVSVGMLRANINSALSDITGMLSAARDAAQGARIAHIDVTLAIDVDGSVGLLGTGIHASTQGSMTVRLEFPADADNTEHGGKH
jgi:hypothetical protein